MRFKCHQILSLTRIKKVWPTRRERGLLALTGTLKTTPREMNVGYVTAMPKFIRTLKAAEGHNIRNQSGSSDVLFE